MKFKFCADGDCPLWALAALHALGSLPAQLFRSLLHQVLEEKDEDGIMEILKDTSLSSREESARAAAAVRWVLRSAWACACPGAQLAKDLGVLGVPRAHLAALAEAAEEHREAYVEGLQTNGFGVNKVTDVSVSTAPAGAVDAYQLSIGCAGARTALLVDRAQARDLLAQLRTARDRLDQLDQVDQQ